MICATGCRYACHHQKSEVDNLAVDFCFCDCMREGEGITFYEVQLSEGLQVSSLLTPTTDTITVVFSGGDSGNTYNVAAVVETSEGQTLRCVCSITVARCGPEIAAPADLPDPFLVGTSVSIHTGSALPEFAIAGTGTYAHTGAGTLTLTTYLQGVSTNAHSGSADVTATSELQGVSSNAHTGSADVTPTDELQGTSSNAHTGSAIVDVPATESEHVLSPTLNASNQVALR